MKPTDAVIPEADVAARLTGDLRHWYLEGGSLRRRYRTSGWKATLMVVNTVGHLAEAAWHHPDLSVSYAFVVVKLTTHSAGGITAKDLALAARIEQVVHWQPALADADAADAALEGTPQDDPRVRYIKYDA